MRNLREILKAEQQLADKRAEEYCWKADNIVRFFEVLDMTHAEKVAFLARELAEASLFGNIPKPTSPATTTPSPFGHDDDEKRG